MTVSQKLIVAAYRYLAVVCLVGILGTAFGYFSLIALYSLNSSWSAPVIISRTHERILGLTAEVFRARQAADALDAVAAALGKESESLRAQETLLQSLFRRSQTALNEQVAQDKGFAARLASLRAARRTDDAKSADALARTQALASSIDAELAAGLITKHAASSARLALVNAESTVANSMLATAALDRQLSDLSRSVSTLSGGPSESPQTLELVGRVSALATQQTEVSLKLARNAAEIANKTREAAELRKIIATLSGSPYYRVSTADAPVSFAFVPYENKRAATVGQPVFHCHAQVVFCYRVGKVKALHQDEEKGRHPLFNREIRGFLAELELDEPLAAESRVLFLGGAPLWL